MSRSGEFAFINRIRERFGDIPADAMEGIGDDAAVIPCGNGEAMVLTTDMLMENIHFLRQAVTPEALGGKSLAVNLSDVAAMGAAPVASLLSIALPPECRGRWSEGFMEGYHALSRRYGVPLIGGDTTSGEQIAINVVLLGRAPEPCIKRRSGAQQGDTIAVTGPLGDSAAGLRDLLAGRYDTPEAAIHHNPVPLVREGIWLGGRREVHAMIDLSDGLASDLRHIMELSDVGAEVMPECIPTRQSLELAVTGGEDYQLLFTVHPASWEEMKSLYRSTFGKELHAIGHITQRKTAGAAENEEILWMQHGKPVRYDWRGFTHF